MRETAWGLGCLASLATLVETVTERLDGCSCGSPGCDDPPCCPQGLPDGRVGLLAGACLRVLLLTLDRHPRLSRGLTALADRAIAGYQAHVSPRLPARCRFRPTCSEYGRLAIRGHGAAAGLRLLGHRLHRCRASVPAGTLDPPPAPSPGDRPRGHSRPRSGVAPPAGERVAAPRMS